MAYISETGSPGMYKYEPWFFRVSWGGIFGAIGIGAGIYMLAITLVSLFVGGWVACRLSGITDKLKAALHGLVVWAAFTFTAFSLMPTAAGGLISSFAA